MTPRSREAWLRGALRLMLLLEFLLALVALGGELVRSPLRSALLWAPPQAPGRLALRAQLVQRARGALEPDGAPAELWVRDRTGHREHFTVRPNREGEALLNTETHLLPPPWHVVLQRDGIRLLDATLAPGEVVENTIPSTNVTLGTSAGRISLPWGALVAPFEAPLRFEPAWVEGSPSSEECRRVTAQLDGAVFASNGLSTMELSVSGPSTQRVIASGSGVVLTLSCTNGESEHSGTLSLPVTQGPLRVAGEGDQIVVRAASAVAVAHVALFDERGVRATLRIPLDPASGVGRAKWPEPMAARWAAVSSSFLFDSPVLLTWPLVPAAERRLTLKRERPISGIEAAIAAQEARRGTRMGWVLLLAGALMVASLALGVAYIHATAATRFVRHMESVSRTSGQASLATAKQRVVGESAQTGVVLLLLVVVGSGLLVYWAVSHV